MQASRNCRSNKKYAELIFVVDGQRQVGRVHGTMSADFTAATFMFRARWRVEHQPHECGQLLLRMTNMWLLKWLSSDRVNLPFPWTLDFETCAWRGI